MHRGITSCNEEIFKSDRMKVEMLGWIGFVEADVRQIEPTVDVDGCHSYPLRPKRARDFGGQITFSAAVDPCDGDESLASRGNIAASF